jgi:hypothetical protein
MKYLLITALCLFAAFNTLCAQTVIVVSPDGNDSNNGSLHAPFATIEKAIAESRKMQGETTIYLRGGDYRIRTPLIFTPNDADNGNKLTICAFPNENPVLKGSISLTNLQWKPYKNGILKAEISGNPMMDMLLVNGEIRHQARFPNYDSTAIRFNGTSADATSAKRIATWKNPAGAYLHAMHNSDWGDFHYRITSKDSKGKLAMEGGWQNNRQSGLHRDNRMVENVFEELDCPGEWFYNSEEKMLYYYPYDNEDITQSTFETPQLKHLIEVRGTEAKPVRNIIIEGIDLTQTLRTFMEHYEPLLRSDWTIYRGAAVIFEGAENCAMRNCNFYNLGGNGVFFSRYNRRCAVEGSHLTNIGASAICFAGDTSAVRSPSFEYGQFVPTKDMDRAFGAKNNNYPAECTVSDNLIHCIGLYEKQITGVEISMSRAITVSHNSIYDTPRAGINISEGTWGGHILEFNDVFNTVKETGDHGSFNSWGRDRYWLPDGNKVNSLVENAGYDRLVLADATETTIIRNNRFRCDRGWDIDLDDGSSNYHIYNNLCLNGGLKLREGYYRIVENNLLINSSLHRHVWYRNNGNVFVRNIVLQAYPQPIGEEMKGALIDYNIFPDSASLQTAHKYGTDEHSLVYPVRFVDAKAGDYRIDNSCTDIFRAGFQNFDMNFGVLSPRLKALAKKPQMPAPIFASGMPDTAVLTWNAIQIKNLESLGERSATGMDSERGVYVVAVSAWESPLRDFLKANDVILGFAGKTINHIGDLQKAVAEADLSKPQKMVVFRNQKEIVLTIPTGSINNSF